jgi:hypothetical protein
MNKTQPASIALDPVAFARWVQDVAAINEALSERLRDTADVLAATDAGLAMRLYQAADASNDTAHHLRCSAPNPRGSWNKDGVFSIGIIFGLLMHLLTGVRRK